MAKKTIRVATWEYRDKAKKRRRAYYGDVVDLPAAEVKRGEAAGVFGAFDAVADEQPAVPAVPDPATGDEPKGTLPAVPESGDSGDSDGDDLAGLGDGDNVDGQDTSTDADPASGDGATEPDAATAAAQAAAAVGATKIARPKNTAPIEDLVDYAESIGINRAEAAAMERADLIKALS
ncbi:hypothetical protein [Gordonia sp. UCD-TK1]|uniref:hypothetical protein n=1 Tax=Gordonia sp. UCD-TK1 TaxID=1857893 RepID=UPI00080E9209|nr:hypothetical protein [Gordonia sp. UCD-TK1]OCH80994.1 hypothetical protein A9310_19730 [Gordonia sp. UCD-TK1]